MSAEKRMVEIRQFPQQEFPKCVKASKKNRPPEEPVHHTIVLKYTILRLWPLSGSLHSVSSEFRMAHWRIRKN